MATRVAEMVAELEARAEELRPLAAELVEVEAALAALKSVTLDKDATAVASRSPEPSPASTRQRRARTAADGRSGTRRGRSRKSVDGDSGTRAPRGRTSQSRSRRSSAARAPRGQRREQVLQAVQSEPGISTRDVAERIGIAANQVHGIVSRLIKEGALHREDGALHPAAGSSNGAPTPEVAPESAASE